MKVKEQDWKTVVTVKCCSELTNTSAREMN